MIAEGVYYKEGGFVLSHTDSQRFHVFGSFRNGETSKINRDFSSCKTVISGDLYSMIQKNGHQLNAKRMINFIIENSYTIHFDGIDFENGIENIKDLRVSESGDYAEGYLYCFQQMSLFKKWIFNWRSNGSCECRKLFGQFINCIFVKYRGFFTADQLRH